MGIRDWGTAAPGGAAGLFVVFEGLDGSGTSTQARLLEERLSAEGVRSTLTAEPTGGPVGRLVRDALQHRVEFALDAHGEEQLMGYLFAADRFHHLYNGADGVMAQRDAGTVVVCARYVWSSLAYNCRTEEDVARVARLNHGFPAPDLLFYIDVPVEVSLERIDRRGLAGEKYETEEKLRQVRSMYDRAMREFPCDAITLDGRLGEMELHGRVMEVVRSRLEGRA